VRRPPTYRQYVHGDFPILERNGMSVKTVIGDDSPISLTADVKMWDVALPSGEYRRDDALLCEIRPRRVWFFDYRRNVSRRILQPRVFESTGNRKYEACGSLEEGDGGCRGEADFITIDKRALANQDYVRRVKEGKPLNEFDFGLLQPKANVKEQEQ
jgi:hypothetical protein